MEKKNNRPKVKAVPRTSDCGRRGAAGSMREKPPGATNIQLVLGLCNLFQ
jgi:hypothetical protein